MEIRDYLKRESDNGKKPVKRIVFKGERFDVMSVRRWREKVLASPSGASEGSPDGGPYAPCRPPNAPTLRPPIPISPNKIRAPYDLTAKNPRRGGPLWLFG